MPLKIPNGNVIRLRRKTFDSNISVILHDIDDVLSCQTTLTIV